MKWIALVVLAALVLVAAVFVVSAQDAAEPVEEIVEPVSKSTCAAGTCDLGGCDGSCGGTCGVKTCGCS